MPDHLTRRTVVAAGVALAPGVAFAADKPQIGISPSVITNPPRQWGKGAPPTIFPDPDVIVVDPSFRAVRSGQEEIKRLRTGFQWVEGPAWCAEGQYVVFSDVKGDTQYRYIWETGEFSAFREPSFNTNGNAFDYQGRQISCQDFLRRVVRWEHDGSMTILADNFEGKPLNSPNDLAPHLDGSIWFSDPLFGDSLSEGHPDEAGAPGNPSGLFDPKLGNSGVGLIGSVRQALPANFYRWDPSGQLDVVLPYEEGLMPNGICFSPDCKIVYFIRSGRIYAADVMGTKIANLRLFTDCVVDGIRVGTDGMRADRAGNIWAGAGGPLGYAGVTVWNSQGKLIGRIRLPETCANMCFAGPKRDWLFMAASQSVYMLRVNIQGAAPG